MPTCNQVGFLLLKGDQGRAPSAPPSFPPKSIRRRLPLQLRAWEGLGRGKGESRARGREALEFLSRRRRILKNRETRDFRENQGRFRGGLGGIRTPVRPSAATLFKTCTLYFWVYLALYREVTAPAPAIPSQSHPINPTPLSPFVPQSKRGVGFYVCFGIFGGRGRGLSGFLGGQ